MLLLAVGLLTLALAAPSVAGAHGRHHGHHGKHHRHHKAHGSDLTGRAAGTVASFDGTTLTIALPNGSSVSGAVTDDTEIGLFTAPPTAVAAHHGGDDHGWDGDGDHHPCGGGFASGDASDLVAGATVWQAKLDLGPDGATFEKVILVQAPSS
jgi:hypothetical protein